MNLQGVEVHRIRAGSYIVEGYFVEKVKGTSGWRMTRPLWSEDGGKPARWFKSLSEAKSWAARP